MNEAGRAAVLAWGDDHLRPLPWRSTRDPWAVLVSEVMAQQTGVDRVIPRYRAFLARFPTLPRASAAAPAGDVVRLWAGLGYNRRAVNLHRCAAAVVERHGGRLPADLAALLALPGVGPYTARAVLAFAFEHDVGVVDTNVGRVLARWEGRPLRPREAQAAGRRPGPAGPVVALEPGDDGAGRDGLPPPRVPLPDVPGPRRLRVAGRGPVPPGPGGRLGRRVGGGQPPLRGVRSPGSGPAGRRAVPAPVPVGEAAAVMGWPDDEARADRVVVAMLAEGLVVDQRRLTSYGWPRASGRGTPRSARLTTSGRSTWRKCPAPSMTLDPRAVGREQRSGRIGEGWGHAAVRRARAGRASAREGCRRRPRRRAPGPRA